AGAYWGTRHENNWTANLHGTPSTTRALLCATLHAVYSADPCRTLRIWSDSNYLALMYAHWAPALARLGWPCAHSDIIQTTVTLLAARPSPVQFYSVRPSVENDNMRAATTLAK
ncbi:hypothetical protein C8Q77DRAFT_1038628, partial [Trametes polyzona]